jgi:hypothetical protein
MGNNIKFLVYINGQSNKPLVNSIEEAKRYAMRKLEYKPSLRVECYTAPFTNCVWVYDYGKGEWIKTADQCNPQLCCMGCDHRNS